jgi:hypothetical protein
MSKIAAELRFGTLSGYRYGTGLYDKNKLGLGPTMIQNTGLAETDLWAGPLPVSIIRPMEYSTAIPAVFPWAMRWSDNIDWVFFADNATAAATRRIMKATYDRNDGHFSIDGFITISFPNTAGTAATVRGFRMTYDLFNSGTIAAQSFFVTGYGTQFLSGICSGNRIGFGSTVPNNIVSWYEVSGVNTDTSITLISPITGFVPSGTAYVAEDLRAITVATNATTTNGGLFVTKGLRPELFSAAGPLILSGVTQDNLRRTYHLIDNNTVLNTVAFGCALENKINNNNHPIWVLDTLANPIAYKYNLRAPLAPTAGRSISGFILKTAGGGAVVGTTSQANNARYARTAHGPGNGLDCIYFTTTTRVYRTNDVNTIVSGSVSWIADNMVEIPPGGANTFAASSLMNSIEYASSIDKFVIPVNATTTPFRSYITKYKTDSSQFDRIWGSDTRQIDQSTADSSITPVPTMAGGPYLVWIEQGVAYLATIGTTAITNRVYAIPLGGDWEYAPDTEARVITPAISTPNCSKYIRVYVNNQKILGGTTNKNLGTQTEPFEVYYRTAGISDNSGGWTLLTELGDLTSVAGAAEIQFMFEFRTIGLLCVPARLFSVTVLYEDLSTLSNYQPSVANSNITSKIFAWRFATAFGSTVPTLRIRLYDAVSNGLLVDDNTSSPAGTWQKSTDGGSNWVAYDSVDKTNETTYVRYSPAALGDNIKVSAVLTLL